MLPLRLYAQACGSLVRVCTSRRARAGGAATRHTSGLYALRAAHILLWALTATPDWCWSHVAHLAANASNGATISIDELAVSRDVPDSTGAGLGFFATNVGHALHAVTSAIGSAFLANTDSSNRKKAMRVESAGWSEAVRAQRDRQPPRKRNHYADAWTPRRRVPPGRKLVRMTWVYNMKRDGTQKA